MKGIGKVLELEEIEVLPEYMQEQAKLGFIEAKKGDVLEAWKKKNWRNVLNRISEIPGEIDPELRKFGEAASYLLFHYGGEDRAYFEAKDIKLVNHFLERIGASLDKEPWREKFLEMTAKANIPIEVESKIKALEETGLSKGVYKAVLIENIRDTLKTETKIIEELGHLDYLGDLIKSMRELRMPMNEYRKKFLRIGDIFLAKHSVHRACAIYKEMQFITPLEAREKIMEYYDRHYDKGDISYNKMRRKIKRIAKRELGIEIEYW